MIEFLLRLDLSIALLIFHEDKVHGFQVQVGRLRIETVDNHRCNKVEDSKNNVGLVADVFESRRGNFHNLVRDRENGPNGS